MRSAAQIHERMAYTGMAAAQDYRFQVRAERIRSAQEYATLMDRGLDRVCVCGQTRGMHDIAENFMQPCVETGCLDFTERKEQMEDAERLINNLKEIAKEKESLRSHLLGKRQEIDDALKLLGSEEAPAKTKRGRPNGSKNKPQVAAA